MRVLVTGAAGFIGQNLVKKLLERNAQVRVLVRNKTIEHPFHPDVEICIGDVVDASSVDNAVRGCDRVFHLAAYAKNWARDPETYKRVNVGGLANILKAAKRVGVQRVVFTSTNLTLDPSIKGVTTEKTGRTVPWFTEYEESKFLAEETIATYIQKGMDIVIVNPTRVFGAGIMTEANSVTKMMAWYVDGSFRVILGDGSNVGNYGFVDDVVDGHMLAMEKGKRGERYLLGGENVSFIEFFRVLSDVSDVRKTLFHIPPKLAIAFSHLERIRAKIPGQHPVITPGWTKLFLQDWACSCAKAEKELGYAITPFRTAMEKTVHWIRSN